jgi:hypothetical protein
VDVEERRGARPRPRHQSRAAACGLTSLPASAGTLDEYYRVTGFHLCGPRAVRIDMLEPLADLIRVLVSWRRSRQSCVAAQGGNRRRRLKLRLT